MGTLRATVPVYTIGGARNERFLRYTEATQCVVSTNLFSHKGSSCGLIIALHEKSRHSKCEE